MEDQCEIRQRIKQSAGDKKNENGGVFRAQEVIINGEIRTNDTLKINNQKEVRDPIHRQDVLLWSLGIVFAILLVGIVFATGNARQWDATSGYEHDLSKTSRARFLPEPFVPEPGVKGRSDPHAASRWYYWKLPPQNVTSVTRAFPWIGYSLHQLTMWVIIYAAQIQKISDGIEGKDRFSASATSLNWLSLFANCFFALMHFLNTHTTYDALAQDVSVASSQSSVVVILIFILIMEYKDRGLFFGWPTVSHTSTLSNMLRLSPLPSYFIRRYHPYAFSWAAIFTFWYHPMENTWGHVTGAVYCYMLLLQGSLLYTKFHVNAYWKQFLEAWVILHGGVVAVQTGGSELQGTRLWPMFTFGFSVAFVVTQVHGLPLLKNASRLIKVVPLMTLLAVVTWCYSWITNQNGRAWVRMSEILRIPFLLYFYFAIGFLVTKLLLSIKGYLEMKLKTKTRMRHSVFLGLALSVYVFTILSSVVTEIMDIKMRMTTLTVLYDGIFLCLCSLSFLFLDLAMSSLPVKAM